MLTIASALFNMQGREKKTGWILLNHNLFDSVASAKISPVCSQCIIPFDNYTDTPFIFYGMLIVFTSGHRGLFAGCVQSYADTGLDFPEEALSSQATRRAFIECLASNYKDRIENQNSQKDGSDAWYLKCPL